jgi:hypothetical protein
MKRRQFLPAAFALLLLSACSKNNGVGSGSPITTKDQAMAVFSKINTLYSSILKPALAKDSRKFTDTALQGAGGGTAIVNGSYIHTSISSANSSTTSSILDVVIIFKNYKTDGLSLDGTIRFFDSYSYRMACSTSGCASSTHASMAYKSQDGSGNEYPPFNIDFTYNGKQYSDAVMLTASKSTSSWATKVVTAARQTFSF